MKTLLIHDADGRVTRTYPIPQVPIEELVLPGELYTMVDDFATVETHCVADGKPCKLPKRPSYDHKLDLATRTWVLDLERLANQARDKRTKLLAECEWTQANDIPPATRSKWVPYRQALRDIPQQPGFPASIIWPTPPAA